MVDMQRIEEVYERLGILNNSNKLIKREINTGTLRNKLNTNYSLFTNISKRTTCSSGVAERK